MCCPKCIYPVITARIEVKTALAWDKFHNLKELSRKRSNHVVLAMVIITSQTCLTTLNTYRSIVCLKSSQSSQVQEHKKIWTLHCCGYKKPQFTDTKSKWQLIMRYTFQASSYLQITWQILHIVFWELFLLKGKNKQN